MYGMCAYLSDAPHLVLFSAVAGPEPGSNSLSELRDQLGPRTRLELWL